MSKDIFAEENAVKSNWVKWGKVGDYISGTLVSKDRVETTDIKTGEKIMQTRYEIKTKDGSFHDILEDKSIAKEATKIGEGEYWKVAKDTLDPQLKNIKVGTIIGIKFIELLPSKTKGYSPAKILKVFTANEIDHTFMEGVGQEVSNNEEILFN